jgi:enamine deaminase RidA (YjgF/YER057c/UK114 family)
MNSFQRKGIASPKSAQSKPYSQAIRAGDLLFISGQDSSASTDVREQARTAFTNIQHAVEATGGTMADVVDLLAAFVDVRDIDEVLSVARDFFPANGPAWTAMGTQGLQHRGSKVLIHAVAHLGPEPKQCFTPDSLRWWRKYPISGACRKGPYLFISGQMPVDMDGNVVNSGDHRAQARYLFNRMKDLAELAGGILENDLLDILSFSIDPRSFAPMCEIKNAEFLTMPFEQVPCSSIIGATSLHKHLAFHTVRALCEIGNGKAVAYTPSSVFWRYLPVSGGTKKEKGHLLCVAGEVGMDMDGQIICPGDAEAQARYTFNRIREVVKLAGGTMENVVDLISFHKDIRDIDRVMEISREYFAGDPPAWTAMGYPGGYFEGHLHEILARAWIS